MPSESHTKSVESPQECVAFKCFPTQQSYKTPKKLTWVSLCFGKDQIHCAVLLRLFGCLSRPRPRHKIVRFLMRLKVYQI